MAKWCMIAGVIGIVLYILALIVFWSDRIVAGFDHKDFYFAGSGLIYLAIMFQVGAIYYKE